MAGVISEPRAHTGGSRSLALVLVASLALSLFIAFTMPLLAPDEGRNAEVAREMATGGDLVVPHLAGMPYLDKPPAFFWATALSIRALGHTPLAVRIPSIIASLLTLWLVGRVAQRAGGTRIAVIATALLASAPLYAGLSAYVIFDMLLTLCVTIVWLGVSREVNGEASIAQRVAMFAAIALGLLTKGPVMIAWAIGGSLGAALILRSRTPLSWLTWLPGWIIALVPPAIWLAMVTHRFPEFPHYAFVEETVERVSTGSFHRDQPWWFVPAVLVGGTLPWSLATPWSAARFARVESSARITAKVGLGIVAFAAVFFTLSHSKLVTYLLPAFPPLALTAAVMWNDRALTRLRVGALAGVLAFTPILALILELFRWGPLISPSGAPLAEAIATEGRGPVLYQGCYSPGADFLLGRTSTLISTTGKETSSNYLVRYRESLQARGFWRALERVPDHDSGHVLVRPKNSKESPPVGAVEFHRDRAFVAYHVAAPPDSAATSHP